MTESKFSKYQHDLAQAISQQNRLLDCREASPAHSQYIKTRIKIPSDERTYAELVKHVFSHHDLNLFKRINASDVCPNNGLQISQLFHTSGEYYIPPKIHQGLSEENPSLSYDDFFCEFKHADSQENPNRLMFLVGNVGVGKTTFICNFICRKYEKFIENRYIPVKINMDTAASHQVPSIPKIIEKVKSGALQSIRLNSILSPREVERLSIDCSSVDTNDSANADSNLNHFLSLLYDRHGFKISLFIDNIDYLYHLGDRGFFADGGDDHPARDEVRQAHGVIVDFLNVFWRDETFQSSRQGISVVISCRRDTISYLMSRQHEVPISGLEENIFSLPKPTINHARKVISARFELIKLISENVTLDAKRKEYIAHTERLKNSYERPSKVGKILIEDLWRISRKGLRDMIQQISEFSWLEFLEDNKVSLNKRFTQQYYPSMLAYMLSGYRRYAQFSGNVPNIYLINAPMPSNEVGVPHEFKDPHIYTFWLKRLILAYLHKREKVNTSLEDILLVFCGRNRRAYPPNLVRYALSSLMEVPSSEMIDVDVAADGGAGNKGYIQGISITNRGLFIEDEFANSIKYLQLIIDDWRLLLPKSIIHLFSYKKPDYSYLVLDDQEYGDSLDLILESKCKDVFMFAIFLEEILNFEKALLPKVFERLDHEGISIDYNRTISSTVRKEVDDMRRALHVKIDTSYLDLNSERQMRALLKERLREVYEPFFELQRKYYG